MCKIKIKVEDVVKVLSEVLPATINRTSLYNEHALIIVNDNGSFEVHGRSNHFGIVAKTEASINKSDTWVMPIRKALDYLKMLDSNEIITIEKYMKITFRSQKSKFIIRFESADNFPKVQTHDHNRTHINGAQLSAAIASVIHSVAKDNINLALAGVNIRKDGGTVKINGTDGHRLAQNSIPAHQDDSKFSVLIARDFANVLQRSLENKTETVHISVDEKTFCVKTESTMFIVKTYQTNIPDYDYVIPLNTNTAIAGRNELTKACRKTCAALGDQIHEGMKLSFDPNSGQIDIQANASEGDVINSLKDSIDAKTILNEYTLGINPAYLLAALNCMKSEDVNLHLSGKDGPLKITSDDPCDPVQVIMPIRI